MYVYEKKSLFNDKVLSYSVKMLIKCVTGLCFLILYCTEKRKIKKIYHSGAYLEVSWSPEGDRLHRHSKDS